MHDDKQRKSAKFTSYFVPVNGFQTMLLLTVPDTLDSRHCAAGLAYKTVSYTNAISAK